MVPAQPLPPPAVLPPRPLLPSPHCLHPHLAVGVTQVTGAVTEGGSSALPHKGRPSPPLTTPSPLPTPPQLTGPHRLRCPPALVTCKPKGGQDGAIQAWRERPGHGNSGEAAIAEKGPGPQPSQELPTARLSSCAG